VSVRVLLILCAVTGQIMHCIASMKNKFMYRSSIVS